MSEVKEQVPSNIQGAIAQAAKEKYVPNVIEQDEALQYMDAHGLSFDELCRQCGYPLGQYPQLTGAFFLLFHRFTEDERQVIAALRSIRSQYQIQTVRAAVERAKIGFPYPSNLKEVESRLSNYKAIYPTVNLGRLIEIVFPEIQVPITGYVPPATYGVLVRGNTIVELKSKFDTKMISKDGNNADLELTDKGSIRIYPASDPKAFIDKPLEKGALVYVRGSTVLAIDVQAPS
jgi:hypothetical protein